MSNFEIPYWKKYTMSVEEAASYFRIGEGKLRKLVSDNQCGIFIMEWEQSADKERKI